jgi:hypothetical protein
LLLPARGRSTTPKTTTRVILFVAFACFDCQHETLPDRAWSTAIEKRIARIEAARAEPDSWLGKSPGLLDTEEAEEILTIDDLKNAISHCELEAVTPDLIESMLLRSWIRMLVVNERGEERVFQILDKNWDEVHARVQVHVARDSGLRFQ